MGTPALRVGHAASWRNRARDPYSYLSAGQPWINHEWLAEVSFALAWRRPVRPIDLT